MMELPKMKRTFSKEGRFYMICPENVLGHTMVKCATEWYQISPSYKIPEHASMLPYEKVEKRLESMYVKINEFTWKNNNGRTVVYAVPCDEIALYLAEIKLQKSS
jgi:hypothetical protein